MIFGSAIKVKFSSIKTIFSIEKIIYKHSALCDVNIDLTNLKKKKISYSEKQVTYFHVKKYFCSFKELFAVNLFSYFCKKYSTLLTNFQNILKLVQFS